MIRLTLPILLLLTVPAIAGKCPSRQTCMTLYGETVRGHFRPWPKGDSLETNLAKPCRASKATFGCRTVRK